MRGNDIMKYNSLQYHKNPVIFAWSSILASRKFPRAVQEAWFSKTVEKDDVKIIKICGTIPYHTIRHDTIPYHTIPDPKSRDRPILFSLF